jgi:hypothetical protein
MRCADGVEVHHFMEEHLPSRLLPCSFRCHYMLVFGKFLFDLDDEGLQGIREEECFAHGNVLVLEMD